MLQLIPWYDEKDSYMGIALRKAFSLEDNPTLELWIISNLVTSKNYHNVIIRIPARPLLEPETNSRDLIAVREDFRANRQLQDQLLRGAEEWLKACRFTEEFK